MVAHLFVYGTLHPAQAPRDLQHAVSRFTEIGPATIPGILHDLGPYPGVTPPSRPGQTVSGTLFALPEDLFPELDAYEGFEPASPATSLFIRVHVIATQTDGTHTPCWVYLYNQPV